MWTTDGTVAGTRKITSNSTGVSGLAPAGFARLGNKAISGGFDGLGQVNLFVLDGTTDTLAELRVANSGQYGLQLSEAITYRDAVYFSGRNASGFVGLWKSDGTVAGTVEVPLPGQPSPGLFPGHFALLGSKLAFAGSTTQGGLYGLYVSDGTAAGTEPVPINGVTIGPSIQSMASLGDRVVFSGNAASPCPVLWVSDGTTAGTRVLNVAGLNPSGG